MTREHRKIAISGAGGFIGSALARSLEGDGHTVLSLVRGTPRPASTEFGWDPAEGWIDGAGLEGIDAFVHLAGERIAGRWTKAKKRRIRESRALGTRLIANALASLSERPEVLVSASAVGYYGMDRGSEILTEASGPGSDFLSRVGIEWEGATEPAAAAGIRVVTPRFGLVLDRGGGALEPMLPVFRMGGGGRLGSGDQWMSWVARSDAVRALRFMMDSALEGAVNVVAPEPLTNASFTKELGRALRRPTPVPIPAFALRLLFGEMADATLLASQRVVPHRLLEAGFEFRHPTLAGALPSIVQNGSGASD